MTQFPKILMMMGAVLFFAGLFMQLIGRLPGDFVFKKGTTTFYFPIVTSIVISILLTILFNVFGRFK
ncbi:DUF2905 domain-containing protein [Bacillus sp. UMB0893]|uniref:DUF2905 domain-containing protein n=1 Tax=Bacillus sp. UMB0893 TaxID=2066053 RepID=UPI000C755DEC|nr:DUF2905 domain-containing protein [Bacillus sp. UMB0893]PLR68264.1 DUF2905 domain-containing protein [Bacillus sp. UMB0893]QNG61090.1 DUF2905 domain-containing protein [Bacillus sp. PAMC26568]